MRRLKCEKETIILTNEDDGLRYRASTKAVKKGGVPYEIREENKD